ncbi:MAG: C40 family peptidase, partial [Lachnospiraceae bacterium]|nr:C40 family peptidase [Lachnospiraceae bacterium]
MKKITKSIISILILIITVYSLIPAPFAYGATTEMTEKQKEAGAAIAAMAQNLYGAYKDDIVYSCPRRITQKECFDRGEAYKGYSTCGTAYASNESPKGTFERKYAVDCVGFVNMAVCNALNFSINVASTTSVVGPTGTTNGYKKNENITIETAMPGDIVRFPNSHVGICIGNGKMIHCTGSGVEIDNIADVRNSKGLDYVIIYRIMESYCTGNYRTSWIPKGHSPNCPGCSFAGQGDGINQSNTGYSNPEKPTGPIPDDDGSPLEKDINGRDDSNDYIDSFNGTIKEFYYYSGVPNSGTYMGTITFGSWLFDLLSNAADWLIGIMTMGYKIQFIGWASVIQNFATNFVEEVMGLTKDGSAEFIGVGTIKGFGTNPLSVEDILFNRVPILDIDFFNFSTAGGLDIANSRISSNIFNQGTTAIGFTEGDTITPMLAIRQTIANMYVSLRYASIIIMLAVLVYVGLRMALSSVAQEKALYKKQLISWIVGFIVMMFIHYFMIAVLSLNTTVISWFSTNDTLTALYDTVRAYAYEIPASKGWGGTIVYVFLVYYLIKLLFFYFKRFFAVIVLTVMAPILGIAYAVEKMKGKNKSLKSWMKEYTYNVIIQTVHIIIYLVFMGIIVALIESASG